MQTLKTAENCSRNDASPAQKKNSVILLARRRWDTILMGEWEISVSIS